MSSQDKKMLDREAVRSVIQQWNANRLDLFALSEPDENLLFHGVMRFYFQDEGQKVATKCIRVASDATVSDVIETLIEKFRPDMRMLSVPNYALYEVHANGEERRLNPDEKPLLVQLNWHIDDREGRFLLRNVDQKSHTIESTDNNFKRKLSKREKKEQKKKEKLAKLNSDAAGDGENHVAEKLYTELPETSFTRSISNPEAVMRRRRQQKLEKKLQQFRSKDGGPDTGGTLKIYGESLCRDVPYKTLLLSIRDCAQAVVREMLAKYGLDKADPLHYCLVQVNSDGTEYILDDDECPLSILMNHPTSRGSIMFHVRRRPADSQPRRRKKKPLGVSNGTNNISSEREGPMLVEVTHSGDGGRRLKLGSDPIEVGSANTNTLQLFGPSIQPRHCLISLLDGVCTVTPLHPDALTFVNGHHITQPTILHNGSVVMFGRVASYRFVDSPSDGRYNLALSQSQLDSACLYESRSPTSPTSWNDDERALSPNLKTDFEKLHGHDQGSASMHDDKNSRHAPPPGTGGGAAGTHGAVITHNEAGRPKETDFNYDPENAVETETKSISSIRSGGSNQDAARNTKSTHASGPDMQVGQEPILPAVLEFPETHQENFLRQVITDLDVNAPNFKLAPVYTLYLCARYRASTHYRPELQPTERAHKLTIFLHHVANLIYSVIQEQYTDPRILAFWMANSSEFLHFLKSDRHISAFSVQAQEVLAECVQTAFRNLVNCFRVELSQTLNQFLSENIDHDSAAGLVLTVLGSAMALLRRCRVNAALTIQLFSQLFHYINVICFNTIVSNSHMCTAEWGRVMSERLQLLELWAERQGLELAADCHLAKMNQCAQFLQAPKTTVEEIQQLACSCFRLNSLQMAALLQQEQIPRNLVDTVIRMAESVADELTRADGREVRLEESPELHLALLLPDDGFSCDVVRGIPSGLVDFLNPLQAAGMCRLAAQPSSVGLWSVYMHQFNTRSPSAMSNKLPQPEVQVIKLHKNSNGMGLSIVAAKGAGQERLGIYIKSVVPGGAADADGRLQAGDQLLRVDGQSLIGITQERDAKTFTNRPPWFTEDMQILLEEKNKTWRRYKRHNTSNNFMLYKKANSLLKSRVRDAKNRYALLVQCRAADYLVRTGPVVTLEVAKQGAIYHGLATLLQQPSPIIQRDVEEELKKECEQNVLTQNYASGSEESLSRYVNERFERYPLSRYTERSMSPNNYDYNRRRRSSSSLQEELCLQGHQLPMDPRYRDNRPFVASTSNLLRTDSPSRWDNNPSIYIEQYNDAEDVNNSTESFNNRSYSDAHQPLNEDGIASCADSDDIPFIDDNSPDEKDEVYVPVTAMKDITSSLKSSASSGGIMVDKSSTSRRSTSACRKTVSFDLIDYKEKKNCSVVDSTAFYKSQTCDAITSVSRSEILGTNNSLSTTNTSDTELPTNSSCTQIPTEPIKLIEQCELDLDLSGLRSSTSSPTSSSNNNNNININIQKDLHQQENVEKVPKIERITNIQVPLKKCKSSFEVRWLPALRRTDGKPKNFGEGKVRELAEFFERQQFSLEPRCMTKKKSQSTPELHQFKDDQKKLTPTEQEEILRQLKEWSEYGTTGKKDPDRYTKDHDTHHHYHHHYYTVVNLNETDKHILNRIDKLPPKSKTCWRSEPNLDQYDLCFTATSDVNLSKVESTSSQCLLRTAQKLKSSLNCTPLVSCSTSFCYKSCPEIYRPLKYQHHQSPPSYSPFHSSKFMTPRKVKRNQKQKMSGGNRRMSERDISRMGTDGQKAPLGSAGGQIQHLPNSKSVPALHHVGNIGMSGSKSRSIHSLVNNNEQGFYQNLSVYRAQNQSQPILNERPQMASQTTINSIGGTATTTSINQSVLSRPTSAYYNSNNTVNTMPSANSISYLLSPGSNTVSNNSASNGNISAAGPSALASHQHHQHLQQQQQQQQQQHVPPQQSMMGLGARSKNPNTFARDIQNQHSLRLNQMMAPSMPNIAHSSGYASNISASQSMQNVNMIPGQGPPDGLSNQYPNTPPNLHMLTGHHPDFAGQQRIQNPGNAQIRAQAKLAEMGELVNRRNQRHDIGMHALDGQLISPTGSTGTIPKPIMPPMHNPNMQRMSPVKQLPPTAPKPQANRSQAPPYMQKPHGHEESTPPLPPTTTHPLFKTPNTSSDINYVASTLDPPKAAYYPVTATTASSHQAKNFIGTNPWEREEREKENEIRREHIRQWRDQQISELSAIQHRTPQQEEQLKTLVLERDFERRALEVEDPEDDSETNYSKDNVQEVIRLANQPNTIQAPVTNFRQIDVKVAPTAVPPPEDTPTTMADPHQSYQSYPIQQSQIVPTPAVQPKSILKHNRYDGSSTTMPSSPSKSQKSASFADDHKLQTEHQISQITKEIAGVDLNSETINPPLVSRETVDPMVPPPPPPERGSSYLVMSQQQHKIRNSNPQVLKAEPPNPAPAYISSGHKRTTLGNGTGGNNNNNNNSGNSNNNNLVGGLPGGNPGNLPNSSSHIISSSSSSSSSSQMTNTNSIGMTRDNKRVSFHDEENNMIPSPEFTPEQADLEIIREDPNRFIQETTAILQTPTTPEADVWNNTIQSTPGVIGAQEVYRDPRQKRLQEQQQKQQQKSSDAVPEKLSFKEKMKMFALESGENQTPKDKLKISRAQRDIDAVH